MAAASFYSPQCLGRRTNLVPRVFSLSNMAAAGVKTLAHSRNHVTDLSTESNLVPRVFSLSNMAAAGEKTLAHSELKRSLIGAFHSAFIRALSLVYSFQNKEGFVEAEKCFLQCLRPKKWTEFRSDCSENCDYTVGRQRFEYSDIW